MTAIGNDIFPQEGRCQERGLQCCHQQHIQYAFLPAVRLIPSFFHDVILMGVFCFVLVSRGRDCHTCLCLHAAPASGVPVSDMGSKYQEETFALRDLIMEYLSLVITSRYQSVASRSPFFSNP